MGLNNFTTTSGTARFTDIDSDNITNSDTITSESVDTQALAARNGDVGVLSSTRIFAGGFDGADADARLDNALAARSNKKKLLVLEAETYNQDRTFNNPINIRGLSDPFDGTEINATYTFNLRSSAAGLTNGTLVFTNRARARDMFNCDITIDNGNDRTILNELILGSVTFASGTSLGIVDSSASVSVTDNGTNTVGDIA
jgi:hypothetical protein